MRRDALEIIEEYLRSEERVVRSNAVTALAALGGERAFALLESTAASDSDPSVRRTAVLWLLRTNQRLALNLLLQHALSPTDDEDQSWALGHLLDLKEESAASAAEQLVGILQSEPANEVAYMILGRLKRRAVSSSVPGASLRKRVGRAASARQFDPETGLKVRGRTSGRWWGRSVIAGLRGGVVGAIVLIGYLLFAGLDAEVIFGSVAFLVASGFVFAPAYSALATRRAYPIGLQADRPAGVVLEIMNAVRGILWPVPLVVAIPIVMWMFKAGSHFQAGPVIESFIIGTLAIILLVAGVRAGTLAVFGARSRKLENKAAQVAFGTVIGGVFATLVVTLTTVVQLDSAALQQAQWLVMLPMSAGLALAFATVDELAPPALSNMPARTGYIAVLTVIAAILVAVFTVSGNPLDDVGPALPLPIRREVHSIPFSQPLELTRRGQLLANAPRGDLIMELWRGRSRIARQRYSWQSMELDLSSGRYRLEIHAGKVATGATVFVELAQMAPWRRERTQSVAPFVLLVQEGHREEARKNVREGTEAVYGDSIDKATRLLFEADTLYPGEVSAEIWNALCWHGSLAGRARQVSEACQRSVSGRPMDASFRDSRGLNRALTGDAAGAVVDFEFFVQNSDSPEKKIRRQWIDELSAGTRPREIFTRALIRQLHGR